MLLSILTLQQSRSQTCPTPLSQGTCSGTLVTNGANFSDTRYFSGTSTFAAGLTLNTGARLVVCGSGTQLTLSNLTMNGGSIIVNAGASLVINATSAPVPALDFRNDARLVNYGNVTINYQVRLLATASINNTAGATFTIQPNNRYLDLSAGDTRFSNDGVANIGTLINFAGTVCTGLNSALNVAELQNGRNNGYLYTGSGGSSGQTCIRVSSASYLYSNASFSSDPRVKVCLAPGATVTTTGTSNWGSASVIPNCSSCNFALPVEYAYFKATERAGKVVLEWATVQEKNAKDFQVERSSDGLTFSTLRQLPGQGHSAKLTLYRAEDTGPLRGKVNYYRIVQTDFDGSRHYTKLVAVTPVPSYPSEKLQVYPNPSTGRIQVVLTGEGTSITAIRITSTLGKLVYQTAQVSSSAQASVELNLSALAKGVYLLQAHAERGMYSTLLSLE